MDGWDQVLRTRTELSGERRDRLAALLREWSLLADLSFSDLVLFVRTWDAAGWYVAGHVRPSTAATVLPDDLTRTFLPRSHATVLERALQSGEPVRGVPGPGARLGSRGFPDPIEAIPVSFQGEVMAVMARYSLIDQRRLGEMERHYLAVADVLFRMTAAGTFPAAVASPPVGASPRVGDGLIRIDAAGTVAYASPNARSCLRRYGASDRLVGRPLADELSGAARLHATVDAAALRVAEGAMPGEAEFSSAAATVTLRAIPLTGPGGASEGAVVLLRDVSDIRSHERALLSKETTIREIHHRVKNNLQTVGALLRLQARRLPSPEGKAALLDAVARVGTIALVHDALSRSPGDEVSFDDVSRRILAMARDAAAVQDSGPGVHVTGSFGTLPAAVATPLAMVLAELLLNAIEHSEAAAVTVAAERQDRSLRLTVADDGIGFDPAGAEGLGLQIVATLVAEQLHGQLAITSGDLPPWPARTTPQSGTPRPQDGTTVVVTCPL